MTPDTVFEKDKQKKKERKKTTSGNKENNLSLLTFEVDGLVHQDRSSQGEIRAEHLVLPVVSSALQLQ